MTMRLSSCVRADCMQDRKLQPQPTEGEQERLDQRFLWKARDKVPSSIFRPQAAGVSVTKAFGPAKRWRFAIAGVRSLITCLLPN